MKRNKWLTRGMERVLREMLVHHEELVYEPGAGWWIGERQTSGAVAFRLLRLVLVRECMDSHESFQRFEINEDGRKILKGPGYAPLKKLLERMVEK